MEAFPHLSTIDYFVENEADKYPQSHVLDFHNKADGHERRIATYLVENLRTATDLEVCNAAALVIIRDSFMTDSKCRRTSTSHRSFKQRQ